MAWPVPTQYPISTPYGARGHHWSCNENASGGIHTGDDFKCPKGTPIYAPIKGQIRHRDYGTSSFGPNQFAISPDPGQPFGDGEVFFAHTLDRLPDGTWVEIGDEIAHVGDLGNATGFHLHAEYMPHTKGVWYCGVHADPGEVWAHASSGGGGGSSGGPYVTADIYSEKLGFGEPTNGDSDSNTVKELQERLNRVSLVGGQTLAISGRYDADTDEEVRLWQEQIVHDPPDPPGQSYLGPAQRAAMFPAPAYTIHDNGLPAIASGGGGDPGGGGSPDTPPPGGGSTVPPAVPALIYPSAIWDPIPKTDGSWFLGLRPFVGDARKVTLHTTQTTNKPNWAAQQSGIPHFTIDLQLGTCWQHLPLDIAAYTMNGGDHSPNSDSGVNIQIEIIGYAEDSPGLSDLEYDTLRSLLVWLGESCGVPLTVPFFFEPNAHVLRRDWATWEAVSGVVGHQHAPYNDHWDPGNLDEEKIVGAPPVEPPIEPLPPTDDWKDWVYDHAGWIAVIGLGVLLGAALIYGVVNR